MTPVFGDFLSIARQRTSAAGRYDGELSADAVAEAITELDRLFTAISRYIAEYQPPAATAVSGSADSEVPVLGSAVMLDRVARHIRLAASTLPPASAPAGHPLAAELRAASDALNAGHDLLRGHASSPADEVRPSPWLPVITARPVGIALVRELSQIAARLALLLARISVADPHGGRPALAGSTLGYLSVASGWLIIGNKPMTAATPEEPGAKAAAFLLNAVPANIAPPRAKPAGAETISELRAAISSTATRLEYYFRRHDSHRDWPSPAAGSRWRHNALATAIISHNSELLLGILTSRARQLGLTPDRVRDLQHASDAARLARTSCHAIAQLWDTLSTGTSRQPAAIGELDDLVLRIGRLARANPAWTPSRGDNSPLRPPDELAATVGDIADLLATIRHALSAITATTCRDQLAVCQAATVHGIYLPARQLPESDDLIHVYHYRPATEQQIASALMAYTNAATAGSNVLVALDDLLLAAAPPDRTRAMAQNPAIAARFLNDYEAAQPEPSRSPRPEAGQLERHLRSLNIGEPGLIAQAVALDQAGQKLISKATEMAVQRDLAAATAWAAPAHPLPTRSRSGAQTAAQDLPAAGSWLSDQVARNSPLRRSAKAAPTVSTGRR